MIMGAVSVRRATVDDAEAIGVLFDEYRQFYEQPPDRAAASDFIRERLRRGESIVLVAGSNDQPMGGFCQIYPTFCSVAAAPIFVLYDLYVRRDARRSGIAKALLLAARDAAVSAKVVRMDLQTARTNGPARALYESLGWELDSNFDTYHLTI
jgi:ribosomal protein S18 acetylase RimI-like enzyme